MGDGMFAGDLIDTDQGYQSCDLYLSAFFMSAGCKIINSYRDQRSKRVYFVFEKNSLMLDLKIQYYSREAKVCALTYADNVKCLKSLCHNVVNIA
jgi:hypothetical protein